MLLLGKDTEEHAKTVSSLACKGFVRVAPSICAPLKSGKQCWMGTTGKK